MKFLVKHRLIICTLIGLLFVAEGIIQGVFKFKVDSQVSSTISFILMVVVFYLLFGTKKYEKNVSADTTQADGKQDSGNKDESKN